jgi:hypothetical protein
MAARVTNTSIWSLAFASYVEVLHPHAAGAEHGHLQGGGDGFMAGGQSSSADWQYVSVD